MPDSQATFPDWDKKGHGGGRPGSCQVDLCDLEAHPSKPTSRAQRFPGCWMDSSLFVLKWCFQGWHFSESPWPEWERALDVRLSHWLGQEPTSSPAWSFLATRFHNQTRLTSDQRPDWLCDFRKHGDISSPSTQHRGSAHAGLPEVRHICSCRMSDPKKRPVISLGCRRTISKPDGPNTTKSSPALTIGAMLAGCLVWVGCPATCAQHSSEWNSMRRNFWRWLINTIKINET